METRSRNGLLSNIKSKMFSRSLRYHLFNLILISSAIDELPFYLEDVMRLIERCTGLSGTFIVGGPMPAMNGALSTIRSVPLK
jgi:hypothetical protein